MIVRTGQEKGIRAGTENLASIAGFAKACQLTTARESKYGATKNMRDYLEAKINEISDEVVFFGENSLRLPNTSLFTMPGVESSIQLMNFDLEGFAISSGAACSSGKVETSHVLTAMNTPVELADSAIRVSISGDQEKSEIDSFINCWQKIFHRLSNNKTNMEQVAS
jgi:cysteine desulfurase